MLDPAKLAWGLRRACLDLGVRVHEHTRVTGLRRDGAALRAAPAPPAGAGRGARAAVRARQVVLATNAFPPLLRRLRAYIVPVYDYALMTEPLTAAQRDAIGWRNRQGLADTGNQFHYYRITADGRILFGGYDAVYHYGNRVAPELEQRAGHLHRPRRALLHHVPAAGGACGSATAGAASSTPAPGSARSSAPPTTGGWRTRPATPGSASGPPGSAPG